MTSKSSGIFGGTIRSMWLMIFLTISLVTQVVQGRLSKETVYDGVYSGRNYNQYLRLNGKQGFKFGQIPNFNNFRQAEEFTLLVWFKLDKFPWDPQVQRDMNLIHVEDRLRCQVTRRKSVDCQSGLQTREFSAQTTFNLDLSYNSRGIELNKWYLVAVTSDKGSAKLAIYDQSFEKQQTGQFFQQQGPINEAQTNGFHPFAGSTFSSSQFYLQDVYVGINVDGHSETIIGAVRQVQLIGEKLDSIQKIKNAAFNFLLSEAEDYLMFQATFFNASEGLVDSKSKIKGSIIGKDTDEVQPVLDPGSQYFCWKVDQSQLVEQIDFSWRNGFKLNTYDMPSQLYGSSDVNVVLRMWVYRKVEQGLPRGDEILFNHENVMTLMFRRTSYQYLTVYHNGQPGGTQEVQFLMPRGRWMWVVAWHTQNSHGLHLQDQRGITYSDGSQTYPAQGYNINKRVNIGQNFNGHILGMKYYKQGKPNDFSPQDFRPELDGTSELIFYFRFQPDGLIGTRFKNLRSGYDAPQYALTVPIQLEPLQFMEGHVFSGINQPYRFGSLQTEMKWDGIACEDERKRLYFERDTGNAKSEFQFTKVSFTSANFPYREVDDGRRYDSVTIEFWYRVKSQFYNTGERHLLTLYNDGQAFIKIVKTVNDQIKCMPFYDRYGNDPRYSVEFYDRQQGPQESESWHHVSCIVDQRQQIIQGTIFRLDEQGNNKELGYVVQAQKFIKQFSIEQGRTNKFTVQINGDQNGRNGLSQAFYSEVRVWSTARTVPEIRANRHKLIDYVSERKNLVSYMQLMGGGAMWSHEPDLGRLEDDYFKMAANLRGLQPFPVAASFTEESWRWDNGASWRDVRPLVLCPQRTFIDRNQAKCVRDSLEQVYAFAMRATADGPYTITANVSKLVTPELRQSFADNFAFKWSVSSVRTFGDKVAHRKDFEEVVAKQASQLTLNLQEADLVELTEYELGVNVMDARNRQQDDMQASLWFQASRNCTFFRDKLSGASYVKRFIETNKGSTDITIEFEVGGCDNFPVTDNLKYSVQYLSHHDNLRDGVLVQKDQRQIFISRNLQNNLQLNTPFIFAVTVQWSTQARLSIIYELNFDTRVFVKVTPSIYIVPKGASVTIHSDRSKIVNYNGMPGVDRFTTSWSCANEQLCANAIGAATDAGDVLKITYDDFLGANLKYRTPYRITATARGNFVFGDGGYTSEGHVDLVWIDFNSNAELVGASEVAVDSALTVRLDTTGLNYSDIAYRWTTQPEVPPAAYANGDDRRHFVIRPNYMTQDSYYDVTVQAVLISTGNVFWQGSKRVRVNPPPQGGRLRVVPYEGRAFETSFCLRAENWGAKGKTAFQFLYIDEKGQETAITTFQDQNILCGLRLPPTMGVAVRVRDEKGLRGHGTTDAFVEIGDNEKRVMDEVTQNFERARGDGNLVNKLLAYSTVAGAYGAFQDPQLQEIARNQASLIVKDILEMSARLPSLGGVQEREFFTYTGISTLGTLAIPRQVYSLETAVEMQTATLNFILSPDVTDDVLVNYMKLDPRILTLVGQLQCNFLNKAEMDIWENKVPSMVYGFKNGPLMNVTDGMRLLMVRLDKIVGLSIAIGQEKSFSCAGLSFYTAKFGHQSKLTDIDKKFSGINFTIPLSDAKHPTETQSLTSIAFAQNVFVGANYSLSGGRTQEIYANHSLYVSWRDERGNYLDRANLPGNIQYKVKYDFERQKFRGQAGPEIEKGLTKCVYIPAAHAISDNSNAQFSKDTCTTKLNYEENTVDCFCAHQSFFTVARDEYTRPFDKVSGGFDFQNWQSFFLFTYLMLVLIFGLILSTSADSKEMARLNDMDDVQFSVAASSADSEAQAQTFPLLQYALGRQVQMMDFVDAEELNDEDEVTGGAQPLIRTKRLFWLSVANFHPIISNAFRFDPSLPRQDRFLLFFLQLSVLTFVCFMSLRGYDRSDPLQNQVNLVLNYEASLAARQNQRSPYQILLPIGLTLLFAVLLLPLPNLATLPFVKRYTLTEAQDEESTSDSDGENEGGTDEPLVVDPRLPINLLFQLSAFPLSYLKEMKGGARRRFPFLHTQQELLVKDIGISEADEGHRMAVAEALAGRAQRAIDTRRQEKEAAKRRAEEAEKKRQQERKKRKQQRREEAAKRAAEAEKANIVGSKVDHDLKNMRNDKNGGDSMQDTSGAPVQEKPKKHLTQRQLFMQAQRNKDPTTHFEGGDNQPADAEDSSSDSIDLDEIEPTGKEFVEDVGVSQGLPRRGRYLAWALIAALQLVVLITYSLEGIHATSGSLAWVLVFFASQALSYLVVCPLYLYICSARVHSLYERLAADGDHDEEILKELADGYYWHMVLVEDWKHVVKFQTQSLG